MASFAGHALPGTFLILIAIWWTIQTYRRYFNILAGKGRRHFTSTVTFPVVISSRRIDIESYVSLSCCVFVIMVELVGVPIVYHHYNTVNYQHITLYCFFALVPATAIILPKLKVFPTSHCCDLTYVSLVLCYLVEGLIFNFHLFNRTPIDVLVHTLLVYTALSSVTVTALEIKWRHSVILPLARAFLTMLQGSWLWQVAVTLNEPDTPATAVVHEADNKDSMIIACFFSWHIASIFLTTTVCGFVCGRYYKANCDGWNDTESHFEQNYDATGYTQLQQNNMELETV